MTLGTHPFTHGLHDLGAGNWAWIQPDGGWGWSNAGLIVDGEESLLVDTLFDLPLTRTMLDAFADAVPGAQITTLVNTHSNGDHCNGNELVDAEVITSRVAAEEMAHESPETMVGLMEAAPAMGVTGEFFTHRFAAFEFAGINRPDPTTTFDGRLERVVGDTRVDLVEVGPAHTGGDVLVNVPSRSTVYTGDILFVEGHPILWAGSIPDLLSALDVIEAWQPETIVPGHGPITDLAGLAEIRSYLEYCRAECRARFDRGLSVGAAAREISFDHWSNWGEPERVVTLVDTCYRDFTGTEEPGTITDLFGAMAELWADQRAS
jgi:glyoxylase-like metal-dependent hydrolase (beta-lactamase superfamily II)